mgnify:CR=1 FL=1|jgi:hypothetical protein
MDLGTIQAKMLNGTIKTPSVFVENVELTFKNAMRYHPYKEGMWNIAECVVVGFFLCIIFVARQSSNPPL